MIALLTANIPSIAFRIPERAGISQTAPRMKQHMSTVSIATIQQELIIEQELIEVNAELLEQGVEVLSSIQDETYTRAADLFDGQRIGGHIRHIIEFYERLFEGIRSGVVDYTARRRDPVVETDRCAAIARLESVCDCLRSGGALFGSVELLIRPEDSRRGHLRSTSGRELEAVASHTVHHFALISVLLGYFGLLVPAEFGVSKATLRYR
jgi:hypothetical protein